MLKRRIRIRDEFLMIASHELRTPITALKMQLQMAQWNVKVNEGNVSTADRLVKALDVSMTQVDRMSKIIEDMLDVSRMQSGSLDLDKEQCDLVSIIREVSERFLPELHSARCQIELKEVGNILGEWDKVRMEQVLSHLIANAIKYAPGKKIEISAIQSGKQAKLEVKDQGPGIPVEKQSVIFKRFGRAASRNLGGLGLGLYICKQIIEAHGGKIRVESTEGHGSAFVIELPLTVDVDQSEQLEFAI